jgi:hypothetical protein
MAEFTETRARKPSAMARAVSAAKERFSSFSRPGATRESTANRDDGSSRSDKRSLGSSVSGTLAVTASQQAPQPKVTLDEAFASPVLREALRLHAANSQHVPEPMLFLDQYDALAQAVETRNVEAQDALLAKIWNDHVREGCPHEVNVGQQLRDILRRETTTDEQRNAKLGVVNVIKAEVVQTFRNGTFAIFLNSPEGRKALSEMAAESPQHRAPWPRSYQTETSQEARNALAGLTVAGERKTAPGNDAGTRDIDYGDPGDFQKSCQQFIQSPDLSSLTHIVRHLTVLDLDSADPQRSAKLQDAKLRVAELSALWKVAAPPKAEELAELTENVTLLQEAAL